MTASHIELALAVGYGFTGSSQSYLAQTQYNKMQLLELLLTCSRDFFQLLDVMLDTDAIITLQSTCRDFHNLLHECVEARCKRECLSTYLDSTLAASRAGAAVSSVSEHHLSFFS